MQQSKEKKMPHFVMWAGTLRCSAPHAGRLVKL
jgi:hypothetical protein